MSKENKSCSGFDDCYGCYHACVFYPTYEHRDGEPFCKQGNPVIVHRLVGYNLELGDMSPDKTKE